MSTLHNIKLSEGNIIVPMKYEQLKELMTQCAEVALENYRKESQAVKEQKWLSTTEVAKMFGCSPSTINRWKNSGYLTARTLGGRDFFSVEEIDNLKIKIA